MLELPGMKKSDLRITLATTLFNRVRQVTVSGHSRAPVPPSPGPTLRERKFGRFARAFPVPADTTVRLLAPAPLRLTRVFSFARSIMPTSAFSCLPSPKT